MRILYSSPSRLVANTFLVAGLRGEAEINQAKLRTGTAKKVGMLQERLNQMTKENETLRNKAMMVAD